MGPAVTADDGVIQLDSSPDSVIPGQVNASHGVEATENEFLQGVVKRRRPVEVKN